MRERIRELIEKIIPVCSSWIKIGNDGLERFVDPNDGVEISAHYGATHTAAAFILWGHFSGNNEIRLKGKSLLESILKRWDESRVLPAFHYDFNNFAIAIVEPLVDEGISKLIHKTVCETCDSNHSTVNWLPMRWLANKKRYEWSCNGGYLQAIERCKKLIAEATNADGGIEDRLPHGMSFNLQYDVATVAVLQYLRVNEEEHLDLSKELGFLLNAVAPDGDINYQGRGVNQIFAWGLWVYLLASSGQTKALEQALDYLCPRLGKMLEHNNMMLNDWAGKDKYLWWDYHYASVYTAHCLLWLVLSLVDYGKAEIHPTCPTSTEVGLHIFRSSDFFVSWFDGRTEYLPEMGPAIAAIWSKKQGMICKGAFAPWQGLFGNKYIYEDVVLKNFCGLLEVNWNKDWSKNRYIHKLLPKLKSPASLTLKPVFCPISVNEVNGTLEIIWNYDGKQETIFSLPSFEENCQCELWVDDKQVELACVESLKNQYDWSFLSQAKHFRGQFVKLIVR